MPNNYGNAPSAKIRIANSCSRTLLVAIMFQYQPWGASTLPLLRHQHLRPVGLPVFTACSRWHACAGTPVGCHYSNNNDICVDGWYELPPGETDIYAETDFKYWYWAACFADSPSVCFNSALSNRYTLDWKPCSVVDNTHCFGWKSVSIMGISMWTSVSIALGHLA